MWMGLMALQLLMLAVGIRQYKRAGEWSWRLFLLTLGFLGLEVALFVVPLTYVDPHGPNARYFAPTLVACCLVVAANFAAFLLLCRRWRFPPSGSG
jgi:hypothetical protein